MDTLYYVVAFFILVIVFEKATKNPKTAIAAAFLLLFLVNCVG